MSIVVSAGGIVKLRAVPANQFLLVRKKSKLILKSQISSMITLVIVASSCFAMGMSATGNLEVSMILSISIGMLTKQVAYLNFIRNEMIYKKW